MWTESLSKKIFYAALLLLCVRILFGIDIDDEGQYASQIDAILRFGGPFSKDLFLQQIAAFPILLPVKLYQTFLGNDGIYLFLRILFVSLTLVCARAYFLFARSLYNLNFAWIAAASAVCFVPFSIPSWSYNTVLYTLLPSSLIYAILTPEYKPYAVFSALLQAIVVISYPPSLVIYAFAYSFALLMRQRITRQLLLSCIAITLAILFVIAYTKLNTLISAFQFTSSFGTFGGAYKIRNILSELFSLLNPKQWAELCIMLAAATWSTYYSTRRTIRNGITVFAFAFIFAKVKNPFGAILQYALPILCIFLVFLGLAERKRKLKSPADLKTVLFLLPLSACGAILTYTSSNGYMQAGVILLPVAVFLALYCDQDSDNHLKLPVLGISLIFFSFCSTFGYVYHDQPVRKLTHQMGSGPFHYLFTTPERAEWYTRLNENLSKVAINHKTLFIINGPAFYLSTNLQPLTKMLNVYSGGIYFDVETHLTIVSESTRFGVFPDVLLNIKNEQPGLSWFEGFFIGAASYSLYTEDKYYRIYLKNN